MKFSPALTKQFASASAIDEFSPEPLLKAFEDFRGSFFDLDRRQEISAGQLKLLQRAVAATMRKVGVGPGDRVVMALHNGAMFAATLASALQVGGCPIPVHGGTPQAELERIVKQCEAHFLFAETDTSENSGNTQLFTVGSQQFAVRWQRRDTARADTGKLISVPLHPTSGTTGGPKIAARPGPCAVAEPLHYIETLGLNKSDVILCAAPMSHAYAYGMCLLVSLLTSAELVFMRQFAPELAWRALHEIPITVFPAVPIMLDSLLSLDSKARPSRRPRIVLSAGAPLPRTTWEEFLDTFRVPVRPLFGTTETGGISIGNEEKEFSGSVGTPMRGVEVKLQPLAGADHDINVVRVRSSSMMAGYLEGESVNRNPLQGGWFDTGDFAHIDANGRVFLHGRFSEVINAFGYKVMPQEVEDVILLLPGVSEVKVYAARHLGIEIVQASVVCSGAVCENDILRHCERHLVSYKCPTAVKLVGFLPRNPSGKIDVERLAD